MAEPTGVMAGEQFACDSRKTKPSRPIARKASLVTDPYEYLASAVEVMPTAVVAQAEISALDTRRARACLARTLGEIETSEGEKKSSSFAVKVATVPVAQLLGPEAVGLHVLAEVPEESDPTARDTPTRPVPKPKARFVHVTAAIFRVGPAEILFLAFGAIRQFPAASERHLLALLHSRAETHKLPCVGVSACGQSAPLAASVEVHAAAHPINGRLPLDYVPGGVSTLARERIGGGFVLVVGERYDYMGAKYFELGTHAYRPLKRKLVSSGGGGVSIMPDEHGVLRMQIEHGCVGPHEYTLAYGLLRRPADTVVAHIGATEVRLTRTAIPAYLGADGTFVYGLLRRGSIDIVTRTPGGRRVSSEAYPPAHAVCG